MLKNPLNFEIMTPQSVGLAGNRLTVGKLSGRRGLQSKLKDLGFTLSRARRSTSSTARPSRWPTSRRRSPTPTSWRSWGSRPRAPLEVPTRLSRSRAGASPAATAARPRATSRSRLHGPRGHAAEGSGNGPVDALFGAVDAAVEPVLGWHPRLVDYEIRAVSGGEDAQGQVTVRARRSSDVEGAGETVTRPRPLDQHHRGVARGVRPRAREAPRGGARRRRRPRRATAMTVDVPRGARRDPG